MVPWKTRPNRARHAPATGRERGTATADAGGDPDASDAAPVSHLVPALAEEHRDVASSTGAPAEAAVDDPAPPEQSAPETSAAEFRADEALFHLLLARMRRWFEMYVTPAERVRLDRDYADICPDDEDPLRWYILRRPAAMPRSTRRRWFAMAPAMLAGAAINPIADRLGLIDGSMLLPVIVGWILFIVYHLGEYLNRLGRARRGGLFQALLLAGGHPHALARIALVRARRDLSPLMPLVVAGGALQLGIAGHFGLSDVIVLVIAVVVMLIGGIPGLTLWRGGDDDDDEDRGGRLLLGVGLLLSRHTAAMPRWVLGIAFWAAPIAAVALLVGIGLVALSGTARLTSSSGAQVAILLGGLLVSSLLMLRLVERVIAWNDNAAAVEEEFGESP